MEQNIQANSIEIFNEYSTSSQKLQTEFNVSVNGIVFCVFISVQTGSRLSFTCAIDFRYHIRCTTTITNSDHAVLMIASDSRQRYEVGSLAFYTCRAMYMHSKYLRWHDVRPPVRPPVCLPVCLSVCLPVCRTPPNLSWNSRRQSIKIGFRLVTAEH